MVLLGPGCKLIRGQTAEAGVRPAGIVIEPPGFNDPPCHRQAPEHVFVEAFIAKAAIEALDKSVLNRLARGDVVPADNAFLLPAQNGMRGQLGAVVADYYQRFLRVAMIVSSSRATRRPEIDVSTISARH